MRYLLHSENATYDAASKKWYFNLDKRITHPSLIVVKKCSYVGATSTSYPTVAYLDRDQTHRRGEERGARERE